MMSNDLRDLRPEFKDILVNRDIIEVSQDVLGIQGRQILPANQGQGVEVRKFGAIKLDHWTNGPVRRWTVDQWTNGPIDQRLFIHMILLVISLLFISPGNLFAGLAATDHAGNADRK